MTGIARDVTPAIIGALLDAVSMGMRKLQTTELAEYPRMADFAHFIVAAEPALWKLGLFMEAYTKARAEAVATGLDGSPVAQAMRSMMVSRQSWKGTATDLLDALSGRVDEQTRRLKVWPKTSRGLSNVVTRLSPSFRADGLNVSRIHGKSRIIVIEKVTDAADAKPPCAIPAGIRKEEGKALAGGELDSQQDSACISASLSTPASISLPCNGFEGVLTADATKALSTPPFLSTPLSTPLKPFIPNVTDAGVLSDARKQVESCDIKNIGSLGEDGKVIRAEPANSEGSATPFDTSPLTVEIF